MSSENPEMTAWLFYKINAISCKCKCCCHFPHTLCASRGWAVVFIFLKKLFLIVAAHFLLNSFFFYWTNCFLFSWNSFFLFEAVDYYFDFKTFQNFRGVGRLAREGQAPRTLYMHICIWKDEIITSIERNSNHFFFIKAK